ncbi:hypothetical protein AJ80_01529 [Polytolypa hystricis UAMH7299]|uniref:Zn(2)-C6 fungal-type domain-containing protein n=1 Tax=Polytolypa hystricis (strain UAMH7299) TaxID=1447883 RepID=A0A2B7YZK0_POLH7|nr:hypothetical protein AJ80_01529 [Polytolypa hystricis UAMH7299]
MSTNPRQMSPKRKHHATQYEGNSAHSPAEYPKKRAAIACTLCRLRKTRCDAVKPACGFCSELGVDCTYAMPASGSYNRSSDQGTLQRIEEGIQALQQQLGALSQSFNAAGRSALERSSSLALLPAISASDFKPLIQPSNDLPAPLEDPSVLGLRQTQGERCARPNLLTFSCTPTLNAPSWDDTEAFYDDELEAGEHLARAKELALTRYPDLSRNTTRYLQQGFVENFLRWLPIWDIQDCLAYVERARDCDFHPSEPSSCVAMLLFAIGAISQAGATVSPDQDIPGIAYFARGSWLLDCRPTASKSFVALQCRFLQAIYLQFCFMPLEAWNTICTVSMDLMHTLSSSLPGRLDGKEKKSLHRLFWACSNMHQ